MLDRNLEWIGDGSDVDFLVPPDKFRGMEGELVGLTGVKVDIKGAGSSNNQIRPFF
jgi:hypothetical protein